MPKLPVETTNDEQGPSGSWTNEKRDDTKKEYRQPEEPMEQNSDQAGRDDDKAESRGVSSLDFNISDEDEEGTETLTGTTEAAVDETSMLEPPSAIFNAVHRLPASSFPGKNESIMKKFFDGVSAQEKNRRRSPSTFLGNPAKKEWVGHHRDHENRISCGIDKYAFMEEVWPLVQWYETQSLLKTYQNRPLMQETLDKLDECK